MNDLHIEGSCVIHVILAVLAVLEIVIYVLVKLGIIDLFFGIFCAICVAGTIALVWIVRSAY